MCYPDRELTREGDFAEIFEIIIKELQNTNRSQSFRQNFQQAPVAGPEASGGLEAGFRG